MVVTLCYSNLCHGAVAADDDLVIFAENKEIYEDHNVGASFGSNPVTHHVFVMS